MDRTQISLEAEDRALLAAAAAETGHSMSALVRAAIRATYAPARPAQSDFDAIDAAFGSWTGDRAAGEEWVDRLRSGERLNEPG